MSIAVSRLGGLEPAMRSDASASADQSQLVSPLVFDLVTDIATFEALEPEWNALFEAAATPAE